MEKIKNILNKLLYLVGIKQTHEQIQLIHLSKVEILIKNTPTNKLAWMDKGLTLCELKRYEEALGCYNFILDMDSENIDALTKKGLTLFNLNRFEEAIACFDKVLEKNLFNSSAWFNKGIALIRIEKFEDAQTLFDKMAIVNSDDPLVWLGKSTVFAALGKVLESEECMKKANLPFL